jgi:DNA-binding transcriptional LysR family regulator
MTPGGDWGFQKGGKGRSFRPKSRLRVNSADVAIAGALAGRGITRVLSYMIAPQLAAGSLELVLDDFGPPSVPVHIVHKEAAQTSARVRAVVDHLVENLRKDSALNPN